MKVLLPRGLPRETINANLKHCAATFFNSRKPDAVMVLGYFEGDATNRAFTAGRVVFAPFGDWGRAQDGVAYNLPSSEFKYSIMLEPDPVVKAIEFFGGKSN